MLEQAIESLKTYDWGQDMKVVQPIEDEVIASHGDAERRAKLEEQLTAILSTEASYDAKQFVCRQLRVIGTDKCVPALAGLLADEQLSHMARYALQNMPSAEAGKVLREALSSTSGELKVGVIGSLGVRSDSESVQALAGLLNDEDAAIAQTAAQALGNIHTAEAAKALADATATDQTKPALADATLCCAEAMLADGNKLGALSAYKRLLASSPASHVKVAATRGMLACAGKKE